MQFGGVSNKEIARERLRCHGVAVRGRREHTPLFMAALRFASSRFVGVFWYVGTGTFPPYILYILLGIYILFPIYLFIYLYILYNIMCHCANIGII